MKGIILSGGSGTRLYPITKAISKQLLPIYDKPMIFYPLSLLMFSGIKEILIISTDRDIKNYKYLLGDGSDLGLKFSYIVQPNPDGLAQAFILGEEFIGDDDVCLVLGDNLLYGDNLSKILNVAKKNVSENYATIYAYQVDSPKDYGIVEFNSQNMVLSLEEKPKNPRSNYAIIGLYYYTNNVIEIAKKIKPSDRGELEITSVNNEYLKNGKLKVEVLGRGYTWLDTGTHETLNEASNFVRQIEKRQGLKISCIEEIAYRFGYINDSQLVELIRKHGKTEYSLYLKNRVLNKL